MRRVALVVVACVATALCAVTPANAQSRTYTWECVGQARPRVGDTLVVQRDSSRADTTAKCTRKLARSPTPPTTPTLPPPIPLPTPTPTPPPPVGTGEPVYVAGPGVTLVLRDDFERYTDVVSMGASPRIYQGPGTAPIPSPIHTSQPVNTSNHALVAGRNGGKAVRSSMSGVGQNSADWLTEGTTTLSPINQTHYITHWARVSPFGSGSLAVKWMEAWHIMGNGRTQWNTRYPTGYGVATLLGELQWTTSRRTVWEVIDNRETRRNAAQPVGPYLNDLADNQWHRYTYSYRSHSAPGARDGFQRMWVDGVKVIDISQATVGVQPPGGEKEWCAQEDVDALASGDGVRFLRWPGTQTTVTSPWTMDVDDLVWWRTP